MIILVKDGLGMGFEYVYSFSGEGVFDCEGGVREVGK